MAGVSDMAFRTLCREQGADLTYTEMVSAKGLSYANEKTRHLLDLAQGEDVVAVQLFGHEPDVMASQAAWNSSRPWRIRWHILISTWAARRAKSSRKATAARLCATPTLPHASSVRFALPLSTP